MGRVKDYIQDEAQEVWEVIANKIKNAEHVDELKFIIDYAIREARVNPLVGDISFIKDIVNDLWNDYWSNYL